MSAWRIRPGEQLCNARGETVAGPGDSIAEDHPAVVACPDMSRIAVFVPDQVAEATPAAQPEAVIVLDPVKLATFGRKQKPGNDA